MAITDRSLIPLKPSDFRVLEGERRLSDVRLAERLGFEELKKIRVLIGRWESFLQEQSGKPAHRRPVSQSRGPASDAYWLTIPEVIFIAGKSEAKNADVVQYEAAMIAALWLEGEVLAPDAAPTLRALTAPDRPQVVPTVVEPEDPLPDDDGYDEECEHTQAKLDDDKARLQNFGRQSAFDFGAPRPSRNDKALDELTTARRFLAPVPRLMHSADPRRDDVWIETFEEWECVVRRGRDEADNVNSFEYSMLPHIPCSTDGFGVCVPYVNGRFVELRLSHLVPFAIVERTYLNQIPDGIAKDGVRRMLRDYLAL